jgi:hypothetical protein
MRLAMEAWRRDNGTRSFAKYLRDGFAVLQDQL